MVRKDAEQEMNWDLTSYFPAFNGPEMARFKEALERDTKDLLGRAKALPPLAEDNVETWEDVFLRSEDLFTRLRHLGSYVGCLTAADARNEAYLKEEAALTLQYAEGTKLQTELLRGLKTASDGSLRGVRRPEGAIGRRLFPGTDAPGGAVYNGFGARGARGRPEGGRYFGVGPAIRYPVRKARV